MIHLFIPPPYFKVPWLFMTHEVAQKGIKEENLITERSEEEQKMCQ